MIWFFAAAVVMGCLYYSLALYKQRKTADYIREQNMPPTIPKRSYFSFFVRSLCFIAAWLLLALAFTQVADRSVQSLTLPKNGREFLPKVDEVAFVLDVSASMGATDTSNASSRFSRAKEIISGVIENLGGINCSLMIFAGNSQTQVPDTLDYLYFRILLDAVGINDAGESGTNLLAMVDAVKAKYVNSPYKKSVCMVLLTDGEDTGFLDLAKGAREQAEAALLDHIAETASNSLRWEIIGLGSTKGATVPDVQFNGQPVVSEMKKELLERMAKAAHGHFYAESDTSVTEISDDILADVAGSNVASQSSSVAPRQPLHVVLLIALSALLIFFGLILPQYQKKAAVLFMLLFATNLSADERAVDTAIEFATAGRGDLALQQLQRLLETDLTAEERATVLYNCSVIYANANKYWEALLALNQIDDQLLAKTTPELALQIVYNGIVSSIGYAKGELKKIVETANYTEQEIDQVEEALESAKLYSKKLDQLTQKSSLKDIAQPMFVIKTQAKEDILNISHALSIFQQFLRYEQLDKTALLDELGAMIQEQIFALMELYSAKSVDSSLSLYMQKYKNQNEVALLFCIDRLELYLQAPAKREVAELRQFFAAELERLRETLKTHDIETTLETLESLSTLILLIQAELANSDVEAMLDERIHMAMEASLTNSAFWNRQWDKEREFFVRFLEKKHSPYATGLAKRLHNAPLSLNGALDDAYYWKILTQQEGKTYKDLVTELHGASKVDYKALMKTIDPLFDRIKIKQIDKALEPLAAMRHTESPLLLFQDVMKSWFFVDPKSALSFLFGVVIDETNALQVNRSIDPFTAKTDYELLMHLLGLMQTDKAVYQDLMKRRTWFTDKNKTDRDFFTMSIELFWLREMLTGQTDTLEGVTARVDFGVEFQKKSIFMMRFQPAVEPLFAMQKTLIQSAQSGLKGDKFKKVQALLQDAYNNITDMQRVLEDLDAASKILHSQKSESESESDQSASTQKQSLKLNPELSIRLLQEMERDDTSVKTQNIPQVSGKRPW